MTRLAALALVAAAVAASACRTAHLGPDTGVAYRGALEAQRASAPARTPTFGAEDAHTTNAARRGAKGAGAAAATPGDGAVVIPMPAPAASSSSGLWPGSKAGISLEAK